MRDPSFWWREDSRAAALLSPLAALYGAIAASRLTQQGVRAAVPVICIGNPTVGGAGKTPVAIAVARMLDAEGYKPFLLSRGYGGRHKGPLIVDTARHAARDVGDEPLLLARTAPTVIARRRERGAVAAVEAGANVIVMDDGFQNPSVKKDLSILVIDARRGIGNGRVVPAGPLRAPLAPQFARADALLVIGDGHAAEGVVRMAKGLPVFRGRLAPDPGAASTLKAQRVLAFAGIGDPEKFFATLRQSGVAVEEQRSFPDHHRYARDEADDLVAAAERHGLALVTTEKDIVRLAGDPATAQLAARATALPVTLALDDAAGFRTFVLGRLTPGA